MRKERFNEHRVYYKYMTENGKVIDDTSDGYYCYSRLTSEHFNKTNVLNLFKFNTNETSQFAKEYIGKLAKIFDLKVEWINNDNINVSNFASFFYLKLFVTLFRFLFEQMENKPQKNVAFLKQYIEDKRRVDLLSKLITAYNKTGFRISNANHDIRESNDNSVVLAIKTKRDLKKYVPKFGGIHAFFKKV